MRGKPCNLGISVYSRGLIPAHAGKTLTFPAQRTPRWAHPRACGENTTSPSASAATAGSSPRMRGKPRMKQARSVSVGLIPAHAGKTPRKDFRPLIAPAHPRACGENVDRSTVRAEKAGSSPRMRGKPLRRLSAMFSARLIPAHAGKTVYKLASGESWPAHPRACGENAWQDMLNPAYKGSSPRMRGKPSLVV